MMKIISSPFSKKNISSLKAGDRVLISGTLYTARDAAHKKLFDLLQKRKKLPIGLKDQIIYYVGPTPAKKGAIIGSAGPTTSSRMDKYTPLLLKHGLLGMIGKGRRSAEVKNAIIKNKAIYFVTFGGAGAYLSKRIKRSEIVSYHELGTEAIRKILVEDFPAVVAIDSKGGVLNEFFG
jgi:fumarate hydratase subunit beta